MPAPTQGDTTWQVETGTPYAIGQGKFTFTAIGPVQTTYDAALTLAQTLSRNNAPTRIRGLQTGNMVELSGGGAG